MLLYRPRQLSGLNRFDQIGKLLRRHRRGQLGNDCRLRARGLATSGDRGDMLEVTHVTPVTDAQCREDFALELSYSATASDQAADMTSHQVLKRNPTKPPSTAAETAPKAIAMMPA